MVERPAAGTRSRPRSAITPTSASPSAGRQRGDGRRPSGNSSRGHGEQAEARRIQAEVLAATPRASPAGSRGRAERAASSRRTAYARSPSPTITPTESRGPADRVARDAGARPRAGSDECRTRASLNTKRQPAGSAQSERVSRRRLAGSQRQQDEVASAAPTQQPSTTSNAGSPCAHQSALPQPQRHVRRLQRLAHDRAQLGVERAEVDLVPQPRRERLERALGVVLAPVEAAVDAHPGCALGRGGTGPRRRASSRRRRGSSRR